MSSAKKVIYAHSKNIPKSRKEHKIKSKSPFHPRLLVPQTSETTNGNGFFQKQSLPYTGTYTDPAYFFFE